MIVTQVLTIIRSTNSNEDEYLKGLGAKQIIHRNEIVDADKVSMRKVKWAGAIDPVGGKTLQYILSTFKVG
ncbi:hypothetical protein BK133_28355 [Paenibacillus sp. FSL H8-0548]|uniref:hypothetical protein n=1 Tax=Paenibacillus sp. FSL H8-0548 TaxID=1920422 RepID=UPI00096E38DC|nr:hypothetical protein [Paenibacillus sp. FSL H8-0548]OMF21479.1 hypothetical protein BK133_28355 [Paenibacillus sp. FSL H8-0548]